MEGYLLGYVIGFVYVFALIFGIGLLQKLLKFDLELSRKLIHSFLGFTWVILYKFFAGNWQIVVIPIAFIIVNALSYKFKLFKMIEREDDNHCGTVYFAIAMTILMFCTLLWPETMPMSGIAVFCLTFGDGFAAIIGSKVKKKIHIRPHKTLAGTIACFIFSVIGIFVCRIFIPFEINLWKFLLIGLVSAAAELVGKGLDNFSVTFGVYAVSILLL